MAPVTLVKLTVQNAAQNNVTGAKNWAAVKGQALQLSVEATTAPKNIPDEWKQIQWSGDGEPVPGTANRRKLSVAASKKLHVGAKLGSTSEYVDVWIVWATIEILTKGMRPTNAAPFDPGSRDNSDKLGAVVYKSLASSVIDEQKGIFVDNMGASGKVAPVATLLPKGIHEVIRAGWAFQRQVWSRNWIDGVEHPSTTKTWSADTSKPNYLRLTPDPNGTIYDLDAPDIRWGERSYETYNNFRQWIEWNGVKCSDYALWYWQARWKLDKDPSKQITLNDLGTKNVQLFSKPFYVANKLR